MTATPTDATPSNGSTDSISARPPLWMRGSTFAAVMLLGALGGAVGGAFVSLSCEGNCDLPISIGIFAGSVAAAIGSAVVVRLILRGSDDWSIRQ